MGNTYLSVLQGDLFDPPTPAKPVQSPLTPEQAKRAGMARVEANATQAFKEAALSAVRAVASRLSELTTDDVWEELERRGMSQATPEPSAIGPVMAKAAREKLIAKTGRYQTSRRAERHGNELRVWESLCFPAEKPKIHVFNGYGEPGKQTTGDIIREELNRG